MSCGIEGKGGRGVRGVNGVLEVLEGTCCVGVHVVDSVFSLYWNEVAKFRFCRNADSSLP